MTGFELFVDDNYHYMDEQSRYKAGTYSSYEEALARAMAIVDEFLEQHHQPGMTSQELYQGYVGFGEDPFIIPEAQPRFSAWNYARSRSIEICREEDALESILHYPEWPQELESFRAVLPACMAREGLGENEFRALRTFHHAVEAYPHAMPRPGRWYWLRLEQGKAAFTVYLHPDRFQLIAVDARREKVDWELRFWGSGRRDRRSGNAAAALEMMVQAASAPEFVLKVAAQ
jgi:hypothetical protein